MSYYSKQDQATLDRIKHFRAKEQETLARQQHLHAADHLPLNTPDEVAQAAILKRVGWLEDMMRGCELHLRDNLHFDLTRGTYPPTANIRAIGNALIDLALLRVKWNAFVDTLEAKHSTLAKKYNEAADAAIKAGNTCQAQLVFTQMYAETEGMSQLFPQYKPTHEIEHQYLVGCIATDDIGYVKSNIGEDQKRRHDLENETLRDLLITVWMHEPHVLPASEWQDFFGKMRWQTAKPEEPCIDKKKQAAFYDTADTTAPDPAEQFLRDERRREFMQRIDALPPQRRTAIHLCAKGLTYKEIAAQMNITVETVKMHLAEARKQLRNRQK